MMSLSQYLSVIILGLQGKIQIIGILFKILHNLFPVHLPCGIFFFLPLSHWYLPPHQAIYHPQIDHALILCLCHTICCNAISLAIAYC